MILSTYICFYRDSERGVLFGLSDFIYIVNFYNSASVLDKNYLEPISSL